MFNFHKDHKSLVMTAIGVFIVLSIGIAVMPAYQLQEVQPLPGQSKMTPDETAGLRTFVAEGCVACHTQQVRSIEMDEVWGKRPSIPSDYYYSKQRLDMWRQSPSLLGSERTGPDLTNIGNRQPAQAWHLLHFYNPREVVAESVMPAYSWMFQEKDSNMVTKTDIVVPVSRKYFNKPGKKIVAKEEVLQLIAYLQSLKQIPMPGTATETGGFIPAVKKKEAPISDGVDHTSPNLPDGNALFMNKCAACHQQNGKGLPGAFPSLAGSPIVNNDDYDLMIKIILEGYDARSEYAIMPPFAEQLNDAEIAAIANHERTSWGNKAKELTEKDVKKIRAFVKNDDSQ